MKKTAIGLLLCQCLFLSACQQPAKKEIDTALVEKLTGHWYSDSYGSASYLITSENDSIYFDGTNLKIEYTQGNRLIAHVSEDETFHYTFEINDDSAIVYPHFDVSESATGGDLAPIVLKKEQQLSVESILGTWYSTESDYPAFIQIKATFNPESIDLVLAKDEHSSENETIPLTFEHKQDHAHLLFLNADQTVRFTFSIGKNNHLILYSASTTTDLEGTARPWLLKRMP